MALIHLIYASSASAEHDDTELAAIVESAIRHNQQQNITGMLLYAGGKFLQILEGETAEIEETFSRIEKDSRHHDIIVLERNEIPERSFQEWNMGFRQLNAEDALERPGFAPFFEKGFEVEKIAARPGLAMDMLLSFSDCFDWFGLSV
jgi:hypothetical protein